jgi:hypothetical protein
MVPARFIRNGWFAEINQIPTVCPRHPGVRYDLPKADLPFIIGAEL